MALLVIFSQSKNIARIPALAHLRAFAAILVLLYHGRSAIGVGVENASVSPWVLIQEGHTGVSLFLVLSGFVFELGAGDRSVRYWPFLRNRLLRTYPLYVFLMLVASYAAPDRFSFLGFLQSIFLLGNLPGAAVASNLFISAAWTLMVEFQFYLLFPFLHRMYHEHGLKWIAAALALLVFVRGFAILAGDTNAQQISYWTVLGRLDEFLIGMVAARLHARVNARGVRLLAWVFPGAVVLVWAGAAALHRAGGFDVVANWKIVWMDLEGVVWALFLLSYLRVAWLWPTALSKGLELIGELSYSMYLLHYLVAVTFQMHGFFPRFASNPNWNALLGSLFILLPATTIFSALTYTLVERPFLAMRGQYLGDPLLARAPWGNRPSPALVGQPIHERRSGRPPDR